MSTTKVLDLKDLAPRSQVIKIDIKRWYWPRTIDKKIEFKYSHLEELGQFLLLIDEYQKLHEETGNYDGYYADMCLQMWKFFRQNGQNKFLKLTDLLNRRKDEIDAIASSLISVLADELEESSEELKKKSKKKAD